MRLIQSTLFMLSLASLLRADILYLKNGNRLEGIVTQKENQYHILQKSARFTIPVEEVHRLEKKPVPEEEYLKRLAAVRPGEDEDLFLLALWCRQNNLTAEADEAFRCLLEANPNHAGARSTLGHELHQGSWKTLEEKKAEEGLAPYHGSWLPAEEVKRLEAAKERQQKQKKAFREAWKSFRRLEKKPDEATVERESRFLAALGESGIDSLIHGCSEPDRNVRLASIMALGSIPHPLAAKALCKRMNDETSVFLLKEIARQLKYQSDRETVIKTLIHRLLDEESVIRRQRIIYAMGVIADVRILSALIPWAAYSPNAGSTSTPGALPSDSSGEQPALELKSQKQATATSTLPEGKQAIIGDNRSLAERMGIRSTAPYYPAAEALTRLTGYSLSAETELWKSWWQENKEDFTFTTPELPVARRADAAEILTPFSSTGSLRDEMLRRLP